MPTLIECPGEWQTAKRWRGWRFRTERGRWVALVILDKGWCTRVWEWENE